MDVDVYAKGIAKVCTGTSYPISENKLFVSPEDARQLGLAPGDAVVIESSCGSMQHPVTIKDGLRQGVIEYISLKDRQHALKLASGPAKVIDVTVKKA
jgi:anaerobic selenocysteine-containing dehydrogenase